MLVKSILSCSSKIIFKVKVILLTNFAFILVSLIGYILECMWQNFRITNQIYINYVKDKIIYMRDPLSISVTLLKLFLIITIYFFRSNLVT